MIERTNRAGTGQRRLWVRALLLRCSNRVCFHPNSGATADIVALRVRATSSLLVCALPISASGYKETSARKMAAAGHRLDRAASGSSEQELILRTLISKRKSGP